MLWLKQSSWESKSSYGKPQFYRIFEVLKNCLQQMFWKYPHKTQNPSKCLKNYRFRRLVDFWMLLSSINKNTTFSVSHSWDCGVSCVNICWPDRRWLSTISTANSSSHISFLSSRRGLHTICLSSSWKLLHFFFLFSCRPSNSIWWLSSSVSR